MIKVLNSIGVSAMVFAIYNCFVLFYPVVEVKKDEVKVERKMEIKENKKIEVPPPSQKSFDQKLLARYEMIDSSDIALENHIISVLDRSKYKCMGRDKEEYVSAISSAILYHTKGNIKLAFWVAAMAQVESSYRLNANPKISTARGFLQVIPRYHPELAKAGITSEDLSTDPAKSIRAGILVFQKYLKVEHGNFKQATARYRGLSVTPEEQARYYKAISKVYNKLVEDLKQYA